MNFALTKKNIITNILALFSGTFIGQFASAITFFLTAKALGADGFGQYAACFALTKMSSVVFNLGMDTWLLREGRRGHTDLGELAGSTLIIKTLLGGLWFVGILALAPLLNKQTYPSSLLYLTAIATWLEAVLNSASYGFNAALRNQVTAVLAILSSISLLFVTILFILYKQDNVLLYAQARLGIAILSAGGSVAWLGSSIRLSATRKTMRRTLKEIGPYSLSDALLVIYTQADITIVAMMLGTRAAGFYSPASSMMRAFFVVPQVVHLVMLPVLSQLIAENNPKLGLTFRRMTLTLIGLGSILWLGMGLFGPIAVQLILGKEFAATGSVLVILSSILFIKACSLGMAAIIVAVGYQGPRVIVQGIVAILNVALNLVVASRFGIIGVAWVYVFSEALLLAGYMLLVRRWQIKTPHLSLAPH